MALDDFSSGDDDSDDSGSSVEDDWETSKVEEDEFPSYEQMGAIIYHHCLNKDVDIEVEDKVVKGHVEEFGKLFALMLLDYPDADPYSLEDPR